MPREGGASSEHRGYWIARSSRAMTMKDHAAIEKPAIRL